METQELSSSMPFAVLSKSEILFILNSSTFQKNLNVVWGEEIVDYEMENGIITSISILISDPDEGECSGPVAISKHFDFKSYYQKLPNTTWYIRLKT